MEQKTLSLVLKMVLVGFAIAGLIVYLGAIPILGNDIVDAYPEFQYRFYPWLIFLWITAVPCYITLFFGWSIASEIGHDNSFSYKNAHSLRNISIAAAVDSVFFFLGNIVFLILNLSHPGVLLLSCFIVFVGIAISVVAASLKNLVYKAAKIREENELTI